MKIYTIIIIITSIIFFIYLNIWFFCKINFTKGFINIYIIVKLFKHKFKINKKIYYINVAKILLDIKEDKTKEKNMIKFKHLYKYRRYLKIFIIKNISFFPENFENDFSIALEFYIVNILLKKSFLNG
ncbi:hypothetical protein J2Z76_001266 [Sedimentibacter acidaminivorans]|uniref:Uncharacterized protein n=1 Tax=Sedimentibacter acidaminivorans TaxID=913099 RepID=A0ABS4GCZ8_9FIRM|nr:hypothetical protein [Sedimentibacter acidaminivorans]